MPTRTLVGMLWLLTVAGCGKNEDLARPVSWYEQHGTERDAKVAWCVDDAQRPRTPDCMNAAEAKRRSLVGAQKDLKPIDWAASQAKP
jgi:hypothetical protein